MLHHKPLICSGDGGYGCVEGLCSTVVDGGCGCVEGLCSTTNR